MSFRKKITFLQFALGLMVMTLSCLNRIRSFIGTIR